MPRHDLVCPACGHIVRDRLFSLADIDRWKASPATSPLAICAACDADLSRPTPMEILYTTSAHQLLGEDFVIDVDDGHTYYRRRVSSLSELRAIERESERHARNEPGCTPLVFRDFSQNRSNRATNTLAGTEWERGKSRRPDGRGTHAGRIAARAIPEPR